MSGTNYYLKSFKKKNLIEKTTLYDRMKKDWQLLLMVLPGVIFYLVFRYGPMFGLVIAFKDYGLYLGVLKSPWVGLSNFKVFFGSEEFLLLFRNTFLLGAYSLLWSFPVPIIFAVLLNEVRNRKFKKLVQTTSYFPSFLSVVVVASMVIDMLSPDNGIVNRLIAALGFEKKYFLILPQWFRTVYISSGIWQHMGFSAVIYIASIGGVDQQLYEAATLDGCGRIRSILHVTIPAITPTIVMMFILSSGRLLQIGFDKVLLLYNPVTYSVADVFSTYVYRKGILESNYSFATSVGIFESAIALVIVLGTNYLSRRLNENSLW